MRKYTLISTICLFTLSLFACQSNQLFTETITSINVYEWGSTEVIHVITDENFIQDLTAELESANSASTANLDIMSPDYHLLFLNDDTVVQEFGYYIEEQNFNGVTGRVINMEKGEHYNVSTDILE